MAINKKMITKAVILSEMNYSESSKILHGYTEEKGKISIMAKGALRPKSPLVTLAQTFVHGELSLSCGRNFYYLNSGRLIDSNLNLRKSFSKMIYSSLLVELVNKSTLEGHGTKKLYELIAKTLKLISNCEESRELDILLAFLMKYVTFVGYRPKLPREPMESMVFKNQEGGIVEGSPTESGGTVISIEESKYLSNLLLKPLDQVYLELNDKEKRKLLNLLLDYAQWNLDVKQLNTLQFIL